MDPDSEMLNILQANLRNAAQTFGTDSRSYRDISAMLDEHVQIMNALKAGTGIATNATASSSSSISIGGSDSNGTSPAVAFLGDLPHRPKPTTTWSFAGLPYRPKPGS